MTKRLVVFFDEHTPQTVASYFNAHEPKRETAVDKFLIDFQPHILGRGGDSLDLACISHWNRGKVKTVEGKRLHRDFDVFNQLLDKHDAIVKSTIKEKFFLTGNHEQWLDDLIEADPQSFEGFIELDANLGLTDRGYTIVERRGIYSVGKLNFIHGDYKEGMPPAFHAKAVTQVFHRNVVYGHYHTEQAYTEISPADTRPVFAQSVGTMGHVNPAWRKNSPSMWVNSFFVAYIHDDGSFSPYLVRIVNGRFTFGGVTYK